MSSLTNANFENLHLPETKMKDLLNKPNLNQVEINPSDLPKPELKRSDNVIPHEVKTAAEIVVVLDESGSMASMGDEPVQAVTKFIRDQASVDPSSLCSLYKFNTSTTCVFSDMKISEFKTFKYTPDGMTAYFDCLWEILSKKNKVRNLVLLIITDGEDNSSSISRKELGQEIKRMEKELNWQVIYIGANHDVFSEGESFGVKRSKTAVYNQQKKGNLMTALGCASVPIKIFRATSQVDDTPEEVNLS